MKPTQRAIWLCALSVPLCLAVTLWNPTLAAGGFVFLMVMIGALVADMIKAVSINRLRLTPHLPAAIYIGTTDSLTFTLNIEGLRHPLDILLSIDMSGEASTPDQHACRVLPDLDCHAALEIMPKRRGKLTVEQIWLAWTGPFGLVQIIHTQEIHKDIAILPNVRAVKQNAVVFFSRDSFFGMKPQNQQGDGSEFSALREYTHGLDYRSIDWKHSARHRSLVCKEFETERNHQIYMAIDTGQLMCGPIDGIPKLDHAINAGLLMSFVSLKSGDRVGLMGFDSITRHFAEPVTGIQGFHTLQKVCSDIGYHHQETNFTLGLADLMGKLKRRSLVIVMTDFVDTTTAQLMIESIGRLTQKHLVLFVSMQESNLQQLKEAQPQTTETIAAAVIADDMLKERFLVHERLRRMGVWCLDTPAHAVGTDMVNSYLQLKQRELI